MNKLKLNINIDEDEENANWFTKRNLEKQLVEKHEFEEQPKSFKLSKPWFLHNVNDKENT